MEIFLLAEENRSKPELGSVQIPSCANRLFLMNITFAIHVQGEDLPNTRFVHCSSRFHLQLWIILHALLTKFLEP